MQNDVLNEKQIFALTNPIKQRAAQHRHLSQIFGFVLKKRPDGLPLVTIDMLNRLQINSKKVSKDAGLRWSK